MSLNTNSNIAGMSYVALYIHIILECQDQIKLLSKVKYMIPSQKKKKKSEIHDIQQSENMSVTI